MWLTAGTYAPYTLNLNNIAHIHIEEVRFEWMAPPDHKTDLLEVIATPSNPVTEEVGDPHFPLFRGREPAVQEYWDRLKREIGARSTIIQDTFATPESDAAEPSKPKDANTSNLWLEIWKGKGLVNLNNLTYIKLMRNPWRTGFRVLALPKLVSYDKWVNTRLVLFSGLYDECEAYYKWITKQVMSHQDVIGGLTIEELLLECR